MEFCSQVSGCLFRQKTACEMRSSDWSSDVCSSDLPEEGGAARFESEVTLLGESTCREAGTIALGDGGHSLRFSTMGEGHIGPGAEPGLKQGAVIWRIDGGEGQFEGATGLITSNFWLTGQGEVVDNQVGVIFTE